MKTLTALPLVNKDHFSEMCGGDAETILEIIIEICKEIPIEMEKLNHASSQKDWEEVFQISHKLKMTFSFLGNTELNTLVKLTEFSARHKIDVNEIPSFIRQMTNITDLVMRELEI